MLNSRNYILVTPTKNEEENLPKLISSVLKQNIIPCIWVIVDDGSTDKSSQIIKNAVHDYDWIKYEQVSLKERNLERVSYVCKVGFDSAIKLTGDKIAYEYLGILDADMALDKNYFEDLISKFEQDPRLGIISGSTWSYNKGEYIREIENESSPNGAARLWRNDCFIKCYDGTNGFSMPYATDTVSVVKAKMAGWKTRRFEAFKTYQARPTSGAEGLWNGYKKNGQINYYFNYNPFVVLLKGLILCLKRPYYVGLAYLLGYFEGVVCRMEQINDEDTRYYFMYTNLIELVKRHSKNIGKRFFI